MKLKKIIPPYFYKENLKKYFQLYFLKKKTKVHFNYEKNFYTRIAFINRAVSKFKDCKYLEIGVATNKVFNSIPLKISNKYGVDPYQGGNYRMTSDEFFKKYPNEKFDVIFIDGLHHYEQCQKDCINALSRIKPSGIILFHDFLPRSILEQEVPQNYHNWSGDVWKVAVELYHSKNLDFRICNIDHGVGILKPLSNYEYKKIPDLKNATYENFLEYYKKFNIISCDEALDFIDI